MASLPEPFRHSFVLRTDLAEVGRARQLISELAAEAGFSEERRFDIQVASSEACANAIEHSPSGAEVMLEVITHHDRLEVRVEGSGRFELPAIAGREQMSRGLGLPLMAKLSDHLALYSGPRGGTLVALTFYRPGFRDENPDDVTPPSTAELLKENELVTAILGSITDEVWFADAQKRFTLANAAAFAEFGAASSEGMSVAEPPAATEVYRADMSPRSAEEAPPLRALAGEVVRNQEEVVRTATGELRYRLVNAAPVKDTSGGVFGAVSVVRDITERKEAEQRYRDLFNTLIEGFCVIEVVFDEADNPIDYRFLETNPTFEEQTGLHDVEGKLIREIAPDNDAYWYQIYGRVALTGEPARFQAPSTPLGRIYDVSAFRVGAPSRRQVGILFNDITERGLAEQALSESEERFRTMADAIPQLAWMANPDGYIYWYNRRWYEYTGTTLAEMEGWGWQSVHDPQALPGVLKRWQASIATGEPFDMEFPLRGADGEFRLFLTRVMPQKDKAGRVAQWFGTNTDISERKRAEEARRRREESLAGVLAAAGRLRVFERRRAWQVFLVGAILQLALFAGIGQLGSPSRYLGIPGAAAALLGVIAAIAAGPITGMAVALAGGAAYFVFVTHFGATVAWPAIVISILLWTLAAALSGLAGDWVRGHAADREELLGHMLAERDSLTDLLGGANAGLQTQNEELAAQRDDLQEAHAETARLLEEQRSLFSRLAEAQHIGRIGSWEWNIQTGEVSWSAELYSLYQVDPDTFVPSIQAFGDYVHPEDRDKVDEIIGQILSGSTPGDFDFRIVLADGSIRYLNTTGQITECDEVGRPRLMVGVNQDITERKRAEQTLLRLNRTLAAHSASDQALLRATDESEYLAEVCRIVVEDCGHAMVWIGYKEDNDERSVRPVASAGFGEDYLETLNITWADSERGRGPTGTAVRTGRPSKCRNMLTDPAFAPWRDEAVRRGYASSIALPLLQNGTAFGAITIYSSEPDPFSDDEVKLLAELTDDLALGITTLRLRTAHAEAERERDILLAEEQHLTEELQAINEELQAQTEELQTQTEELQLQTEELAARERQLREQNEELLASRYNRTLIEASLDPLVTIGLDGTITDVNEAAVKISGNSREEIIGTDFSDYFTDPEKARLGYQKAFAMGSVTDYPLTIRSRDGRLTDVLYNATVYRDEGGKVQGVFAAARDITAIKELEVQREIASTLQEALLDIPEETSLLRFSHLYRSATRDASVGGDFYDVFEVKNDRMAVLIGDVCGHGVEAARVAILVKDVVHAFAHQFSQPEMVLSKTNDLLLEKRIRGFVTVFLGILDPDTGVLKYSSAGHPPALLRTAEGGVEELVHGSAPVGVFPGHSGKAGQVQLHKGDLLLLYTDGLIEARRNGDFFGQKGLVKSLAHWKNPSPELLPQALLEEVLSFSGGALSDDVAMLALSLRDIAGDGSKRACPRGKPLG